MTERLAFLRHICESPADDLPRLVYADWLQERGEGERAEFIRVQVELAKPFRPPHDHRPRVVKFHHKGCTRKHGKVRAFEKSGVCELCREGRENSRYYRQHEALERRERELLHDNWPDSVMNNEAAWIAPLLMLVFGSDASPVHPGQPRNEGRVFRWEWSRGFVSAVTCSAADWLTHADRLHWHPEQTVAGDWQDEYGNHRAVRTPRPCPETAQPITEVTLTTRPEIEFWTGTPFSQARMVGGKVLYPFLATQSGYPPAELYKRMLENEYKGITFTLPPEPLSGNFGTLTVNGQTVQIVGQWTMGGTS